MRRITRVVYLASNRLRLFTHVFRSEICSLQEVTTHIRYTEQELVRIVRLAEKLFIHQGYTPEASFKSAVNYLEEEEKAMHKLKTNHLPPFD